MVFFAVRSLRSTKRTDHNNLQPYTKLCPNSRKALSPSLLHTAINHVYLSYCQAPLKHPLLSLFDHPVTRDLGQ